MSYMALYREWRPKNFEDVIGQDHIITTLKNQIKNNRIAHAYLFTGTRGTGKTSTSKIFAKAVNCLNPINESPCNECEICKGVNDGTLLDVIEMDAASNRKLENALDIIETVNYPPTTAKYKVYIIDEVHMLTTQAFNALLKTIEEPPSYVIFILATTDPQKVPATILSRCQRFDFKRIREDDAFLRLRKIIDDKGLYAEDSALRLIAKVSEGAMRDSLSILDQAISMGDGKVETSLVSSMLGIAGKESIFNLVDYMVDGDIDKSLSQIEEIMMSGKDVMQFVKDMIRHFRNLLIVRVSRTPVETIDVGYDTLDRITNQSRKLRYEDILRAINIFLEAEQDIKVTSQWRIVLEMAIIRFTKREYDTSTESLLKRISHLEEAIESGNIVVNNQSVASKSIEGDSKNSSQSPRVDGNSEQATGARGGDASYNNSISSGGGLSIENVKVPSEDQGSAKVESSIDYNVAKGALVEVLNMLKSNKRMTIYAHLTNGKVENVEGNVITIAFEEDFNFSKVMLEKPDNRKGLEKCFEKCIKSPVRLRLITQGSGNTIDKSIENVKNILGEEFIEIVE